MEARLQLGAEIDIASGKELADGLDNLRDDVTDLFDKNKSVKPIFLARTGSANGLSGTVNTAVEVGSPPLGRIWNILAFTVVGQTDVTTSTAGSVSLYIGDIPLGGAQPSLFQVRRTAFSVPFTDDFTHKSQWCSASETVFFNLSGITGLTQFVGNIFVAEYREKDILSGTGR